MGIQNIGEVYSNAEYEALKKENEQLKSALGEATLDIKIMKTALEICKKNHTGLLTITLLLLILL